MNCAYHPEIQADAYCRTCGKALCTACKRDVKGIIFCEDCIATRVVDTMPVAPAPLEKPAGAPNPVLAAVLGLIPGVGAMYNGQFAKAFAHVGILTLLIVAANTVSDFFGLFVAAFVLYMPFEAYKTAEARRLGLPLPDPLGLNSLFGETTPAPAAPTATTAANVSGTATAPAMAAVAEPENRYVPAPIIQRSAGPAGAIFLIALGVLFLLHNIGMFAFGIAGRLWPLVLIGIGAWMFLRRRSACPCQRCQSRGLMGPAIVVTLGLLFLLGNFTRFDFGETWPVFLLVIGGVKLLQNRASTEGHINIVPAAPGSAVAPVAPPPPATESNSEVTNA